MKRSLYATMLLMSALLTMTTPSSHANNKEQGNLKQVQENIKSLNDDIKKSQQEKTLAEKAQRDIEIAISQTLKTLRQQDSDLDTLDKSLLALGKQKAAFTLQLEQQKANLRDLLRHQYSQGGNQDLKIILNQKDIHTLEQNLTYSRYINEAHTAIIKAANKDIKSIEETQTLINQQQSQLLELKEQHTQAKLQLEEQKKQRHGVIKQLNNDINNQQQKLSQLQEDELRLKKTLEKLRQSQAASQVNKQAFAKLKRKLPWPTEGKIKHSFGSRKDTGTLKWQGIFIKTRAEQDVKSVAGGKVIFSDWLQGFGMLIIIDHGSSYISLYGQNQTLFKEVGDLVEQQDIIASVSDEQNSGLYFELRHKGKPIDPSLWLKK